MTIESRKVLLAAAAAALFGGVLSGCNTVEGVGQDIENAGDAIGDEAREQQQRRRN
jgi:predicted small secreted protein